MQLSLFHHTLSAGGQQWKEHIHKNRHAETICRTISWSAGAEIKVSRLMEDKNPMVLGRLGRNPDVPTVTFYGHYDVQPAMEREWATDPFEIAAIDGYLYGRGTSDNKVCSV